MSKTKPTVRKTDAKNYRASKRKWYNAITDVAGIEVGHYTDLEHLTGTTVILAREGAVAGVDVRGSAPGTRETDLLNPVNLIEKVYAVVLTGGSAYGLAAADGVMTYLEKQGIGFQVGRGTVVPIVPAAALYDLGRGGTDFSGRPIASFGFTACVQAKAGPVEQGNVGAGTGALTGTLTGNELKGGIGTASTNLNNGIIVGALVAVNSGGSPINAETGEFYAAFLETNNEFGGLNPAIRLLSRAVQAQPRSHDPNNTTLAVVATTVELTKTQATKVAQMAHDGIARAIRPAHTMFDGDTVFALSTGKKRIADMETRGLWGDQAAQLNAIGSAAADTLSRAIVHAMINATSIAVMQSYRDRYHH
ncbi:MAG TPA: P1 family peptidase [Thermodesulfobacteriota bacterium]|nr:P1 family peptidase [Thermodesulfobacteriota bacterium]